MIIVADASVLVAELLRRRGRELLAHPELRCVVAEDQWAETTHELEKRIATIAAQGRLTGEQANDLRSISQALLDEPVIEVIPRTIYEHMEPTARRRVPRDPTTGPR